MAQDTALQEMQNLVKKNLERIQFIEIKNKEFDEDVIRLSKEIEELNQIIKDLDTKEALYWDEFEEKENDLIKLQNKKNKEQAKIAEIKAKKESIQDFIKVIENTRTTHYAELSSKQDSLEVANNDKSELCSELIECQKKDILYRQMISSREKEISKAFVDKKQENIENDLISLVSINRALQQSTIDMVIKSVQSVSVSEVIKISNNLIERIKDEIANLKYSAKKSPLKSLYNLWELVEDNANLRLQINNYTEGLIFQTASQLSSFYAGINQDEESEGRNNAVEYAKKIFGMANLAYKDDSKAKKIKKIQIINLKTQKKAKWRLC